MSKAVRKRTKVILIASLLAPTLILSSALASMPIPFAFMQSLVKKFTFDTKVADATDPPNRGFDAGDGLGTAVAISADQTTIVVGAVNDATDGAGLNYQANSGAAYVYVKSGGVWTLQQKLIATGNAARNTSDYFGYSVSVDGDTAIVGAPLQSYDTTGNNPVNNAGAAYVFTRSGSTWTQQAKIIATGTNARGLADYFGSAVAVSADTAIIGAYQHSWDVNGANNSSSAGAVFVFTRSGSTWSLQQKLVGTGPSGRNAFDQFGIAVGIDTDTVAIGANGQQYDASGANALTSAGAVYVFTRSSGVWSLQQKLIPTGTNARKSSDFFGTTVAISADTVVATSTKQQYDDTGANQTNDAGAAYVFTRSSGTWTQQQKLVATGTNGRIAGNQFGIAVGLNVDTIIVGSKYQQYDASGANLVSNAGASYIFARSGSTWTQQQKIVGTGTNGRVSGDSLGSAVAVAGDVSVSGAPSQSYDATGANLISGAGAAFVDERSGGVWSQTGKLVDTIDPVDRAYSSGAAFGNSVALSEDESTLVVGAEAETLDASANNYVGYAGAVYVYTKSSSVWTLQQKITTSGTNERMYADKFGHSVSISGNTLIASSLQQAYDTSGTNSVTVAGKAYIYTRSGSTWSLQQELVGTGTNGRQSFDDFGQSVAISGDTVLIGAGGQAYDASGANSVSAAGAAFVFTRSGSTWTFQQKLVATGTNARNAGDQFGYTVALDVDTAIIGANFHAYDAAGANSITGAGAAFVFTRSGSTWTQQQKLVETGTNARNTNDYFGYSVSVSGDTAIVGALLHPYDANGANSVTNTGAAYVFFRSGSTWSLQQKLVGFGVNGRMAYDNFGTSVAIKGDVAIVGSLDHAWDAAGENFLNAAGAAYVYTRTGTNWSANTKLVGTGTNGRGQDWFGYSVAVSGSTVACGANQQSYDANGANYSYAAGAGYIFSKK